MLEVSWLLFTRGIFGAHRDPGPRYGARYVALHRAGRGGRCRHSRRGKCRTRRPHHPGNARPRGHPAHIGMVVPGAQAPRRRLLIYLGLALLRTKATELVVQASSKRSLLRLFVDGALFEHFQPQDRHLLLCFPAAVRQAGIGASNALGLRARSAVCRTHLLGQRPGWLLRGVAIGLVALTAKCPGVAVSLVAQSWSRWASSWPSSVGREVHAPPPRIWPESTQLEIYLFGTVTHRFHRQGSLAAFDFFCIVIWKANRAKSRIAEHLLERGHTSMGHSGRESHERDLPCIERRRTPARDHRTVGIPIADGDRRSVGLVSNRFTIYDVRVCRELRGFGTLAQANASKPSGLVTRTFTKQLWPLRRYAYSLRDKDRVFGESRSQRSLQQTSPGTSRRCRKRMTADPPVEATRKGIGRSGATWLSSPPRPMPLRAPHLER